VTVHSPVSHTLFDPEFMLAKANGNTPTSYKQFLQLIQRCGIPQKPVATLTSLPLLPKNDLLWHKYRIPSLGDIGYDPEDHTSPYRGGESEGLKVLRRCFEDEEWVATFEKPLTSPAEIEHPSTTVLSPYLKFGCVSSRLFYMKLHQTYQKHTKHTKPPASLLGQLYWREFFYLCGFSIPNFGQMKGNPVCKQIPWDRSKDAKQKLEAWENARTGYPWIDACMTQLREQGWLHHLARHSVACFLTRGDLWVSWEDGRDVFHKLLIDGDWSLNNANWMWLSCSSFFYQYFRVYSPITFGKKYDPEGKYIKHFLPKLAKFPSKFIYEPWKAPLSVQEECNCVVGKDYPFPIVDHNLASKENMKRMAQAYADNKEEASTPATKKARKGH